MRKFIAIFIIITGCKTVDIPISHQGTSYTIFKDRINSKNSLSACYLFEVNGKYWSHNDYFMDTFTTGDKFEVVYDSLNPAICKILFENPIFLEGEETEISYGKVIKIYKSGFFSSPYNCVVFQYTVGNRSKIVNYERVQILPDDYKKRYADINVGDLFDVEYLKLNPQRSVILFTFRVKE